MLNKRNHAKHQICARTLVCCVCVTLSACADTRDTPSQNDIRQIRQINAAMEAFAQQELSYAPETASRLGIRANDGAATYNNQLNDRSQAAFERLKLQRIEMLERFSALAPIQRPRDVVVSFETVQSVLKSTVEMSAFGHGHTSLGFVRPYVADQLTGAYIDIQDLLINRQVIRNRTGALAYITRLQGIAAAIEDDRRRMIADAKAGVIPPDFILQRMRAQAQTLSTLSFEPETGAIMHPLLTTFANLTASTGNLAPEERRRF